MTVFTGKSVKINGMRMLEQFESAYSIGSIVYYYVVGIDQYKKYKVSDVYWWHGLSEFAYCIVPIKHKYKIGHDIAENELCRFYDLKNLSE